MEPVQHLKFRIFARIVSVVELVLCVLYILAALVVGFIVISITVAHSEGLPPEEERSDYNDATVDLALHGFNITLHSDPSHNGDGYRLALAWVAVVFTAIAAVIELILTVKLFKATKIGADVEVAKIQCQWWRRVVLVLILIGIIIEILAHDWLRLGATIVIYGIFIGVVSMFIRDLDQVTGTMTGMHCTRVGLWDYSVYDEAVHDSETCTISTPKDKYASPPLTSQYFGFDILDARAHPHYF